MTDRETGSVHEDAIGALQVYAFALGLLLVVLSTAREPTIGKAMPTGVLLGGFLIGAVAPLRRGLPRPAAVAVAAVTLPIMSIWTAALVLPPGTVIAPLTAALVERTGEDRAQYVLVTAFGLGAATWMVGFLSGILGQVGGLLEMVFTQERRVGPRRELLVPLICAIGAGVMLIEDDVLRWLRPPISFGSSSVFAAAGACLLTYVAVRRGWTAPQHLGLIALAAVAIGWLSVTRPGELLPVVVEVEAKTGELHAETYEKVREAMRRSGIDAHGERLSIRWSDAPPGPLTNSTRTFDGRTARIVITADLPPERRHNFAMFQITAALVDLRVGSLDPMVRNGYAYWSARNPFNPFLTGAASGFSPHAECRRLEQPSHDEYDRETSAIHSLPFVLAEMKEGIREARRVFDEARRSDPLVWRERLRRDCATFLARYAGPELPEVSVDPAARGALTDEVVRRSFEFVRTRTGLDAKGRPIVVRVGTPPGGVQAHTAFTRERNLITVSPELSGARLDESLTYHMSGIFVTAHYAGEGNEVEPVRSGFASWVSQQASNPFSSSTSAVRGRQLCADRSYLDQPGTNGAVWLSSVPFAVAERDGGTAAVRKLLHSTLSVPFDREAWKTQVRVACERWTTAH